MKFNRKPLNEMTTIKFRGYSKECHRWVYGYYYGGFSWADFIIEDAGFEHRVQVDPETVGQFTGLLDKNAAEIYDGDVLFQKTTPKFKDFNSSEWKRTFIVCFGSVDFNKGSSGSYTIGFYMKNIKNNVKYGIAEITFDNEHGYYPFEIIGNIHDNPELFKPEKP